MPDLRRTIESQVRLLVGGGGESSPLDHGEDVGLFGPESACWKVHGDFTSMMIGGIAALLLQMLHPGALAGVWDHSNFREDMIGRLKRTARFIAGTTYGSTDQALALIDHVRGIHQRISGRLPDGAAYSAEDADLLTWVHVAEVSSFLAAYLRYRDPSFSAQDQDRYFTETAEIAERLGARDVPKTRAQVREYLREIRPQLRYDHRTREVAHALLSQRAPNAAMGPFARLIFEAAEDLLPDWAAQMHGVRVPPARRPAIRLGVKGMARVIRWSLSNSAENRARRRAERLEVTGAAAGQAAAG